MLDRPLGVSLAIASLSLVALSACGGVVKDECPPQKTEAANHALTVIVAQDLATSRVFFLGDCRGIQCNKPVATGCVEWGGELNGATASCQIALQTTTGKVTKIDVTRADLCTANGNKAVSFGSETLR